jgi:hypothetical protein
MAQELAQRENRTMSELFRKALRRYMATDKDWDALLKRTRAKGKAPGITSGADVERLSDEFRRDKRIPVVADTNVLDSALLFGGLRGSFLELAFMKANQLVTSPVLLDERR